MLVFSFLAGHGISQARKRAKKQNPIKCIAVVGASLSAGFGNGMTLASLLRKAVKPGKGKVFDFADSFFSRVR